MKGGDLIIARQADSQGMDAQNAFDNESIWVFEQLMEPLYTVTADGKSVKPWLATGYDLSKDKLTYTFHLRKGVKFHNGKEMTADDVKFSLDAARTPKAGWGYIDVAIKSVTVKDKYTVVVKTKYPWAPLIADIALFSNDIVPKNYGGETEKQFYTHPVGTGPFKWDHWTHGKEIKFVRFDQYWQKGKPYLNSVTWTNVPDENTRLLQLKGGQVQIDAFPGWAQVGQLKSTAGVTMTLFPSTRTDYVLFNEKVKPFQDVHVRRALLPDRPQGARQGDPLRQRLAGQLVHAAAGAVLRPEVAGPPVQRRQGQGGAGQIERSEGLHGDVPRPTRPSSSRRRLRRCCRPPPSPSASRSTS